MSLRFRLGKCPGLSGFQGAGLTSPSTPETAQGDRRSTDRQLRVLACEDDPLFQKVLEKGLQALGFQVDLVEDGLSLDRALQLAVPDMILLDLGLPGEDGLSIARRLRRRYPRLGIAMLTARGEVEDRLQGFFEGADLYFVKPVDLRELAAALRSLHRRLSPAPMREGAWSLQADRSVLASPEGHEIPLTHNEHLFVNRLLSAPGETVSRDELMRALGYVPDPHGAHRIETLLSRLRRKVRARMPEADLPIRPRHGSGYAFLG